MSLSFAPKNFWEGAHPGTCTVQKLLDENNQLMARIRELQNSGLPEVALQYQQLLHRNLVFLTKSANKLIIPEDNANENDQTQPLDEGNPSEDVALGSSAKPESSGAAPMEFDEPMETDSVGLEIDISAL